MRFIKITASLTIATFLVSCATQKTVLDSGEAEIQEDIATWADDQNSYGTGLSKSYLESRLSIVGDPLNYRTVYFEYDSAAIDQRSEVIVRRHAQHLSNNPRKVLLEGHADERGTRDYNLALGERRAQSVSNILKTAGMPSGIISTISYGEEKPVSTGHNESDWKKNRRVEIVY